MVFNKKLQVITILGISILSGCKHQSLKSSDTQSVTEDEMIPFYRETIGTLSSQDRRIVMVSCKDQNDYKNFKREINYRPADMFTVEFAKDWGCSFLFLLPDQKPGLVDNETFQKIKGNVEEDARQVCNSTSNTIHSYQCSRQIKTEVKALFSNAQTKLIDEGDLATYKSMIVKAYAAQLKNEENPDPNPRAGQSKSTKCNAQNGVCFVEPEWVGTPCHCNGSPGSIYPP